MPGPRKEGQPEQFEIPMAVPEVTAALDFQELSKRIRGIRLLNDSINGLQPYLSSQISFEEVEISKLKPCSLYVLKQNLEIQRELRKKFLEKGIDTLHLPDEQSLIQFTWGGAETLLSAPIIEVSEDDNFANIITDGLHRIEIGIEAGEKTVKAVVIKNTAVPLSVLPVEWDEVKVRESVPSINEKRRMRFEPSEEMFRWFGLNKRNLERLAGGFPDLTNYAYKAFFRNFDFGQLPKYSEILDKRYGYDNSGRLREFALTESECYRKYSSAGFLVTSNDSKRVLLGTHHEAPNLWGNFAGSRQLGEIDPKVTAVRELKEETGIEVDPNSDFGEPLIVIINNNSSQTPKVGFIYQLKINDNIGIEIPQDSEIKTVKWWDSVMELLDFSAPAAVWGGYYTFEALKLFDKMSRDAKIKFGGMYEQLTGHGYQTQFEQIKQKEKIQANNRWSQ